MNFELHHGDCLEIMPRLVERFDVIITDPPYGLSGRNMRNAAAFMDVSWDNKVDINPIIKLNKKTIIFGGNYYKLPPCRCFIIWDKGGRMYRRSWSECEFIWTNIDEPARIFKIDFHGEKVHPYQKPINLMEWLVNNYTLPGDTIFDPFMGSGTTGVAAIRTGRHFVGIEKEREYFKIAEQRIRSAQPALFVEDNSLLTPRETDLLRSGEAGAKSQLSMFAGDGSE